MQGGSTLTQQVAKTLFLTNARTTKRKVQELLLTLWLEHHFTKQEILEIYLNRVYLGAGAWGMDAAAKIYFGVPARRVTLAQAAVLAGCCRGAPSRFNPRTQSLGGGGAWAKEVLAAMVADGHDFRGAGDRQAGAEIAFPHTPADRTGLVRRLEADQAQALVPPDTDAALRTTLDATAGRRRRSRGWMHCWRVRA